MADSRQQLRNAFGAVHARIDNYARTQNPAVVLDRAARDDAAYLWHLARPVDPAEPTEQERHDLRAARHLLGWLHNARFLELPDADGHPDFVQSLLLFLPFAESHPGTLPATFDSLIGSTRTPDAQADYAHGLLELPRSDPAVPIVAVDLFTRAVGATPAGHPDLAGRLAGLGRAHLQRHSWTGSADQLAAATAYARQAAALAPQDSRTRRWLDDALQARFDFDPNATAEPRISHIFVIENTDRADVAAQLDEALTAVVTRKAVPVELAREHVGSYHQDGIAADLDVAIQLLTGTESAAQLAMLYRARFERAGDTTDLDSAIVVLSTARPDSDEYDRIEQLARVHHLRHEATGSGVDRTVPRQLAERARVDWPGPPTGQVAALRAVSLLAEAAGDLELVAESLREAVSALPRQARWELAWADRAGRVGHFTGITGEAVAAHLAVDDIPGAVEVAEHGRSVLLSGQLDLHTDVSALHRVRPDLAARFEHVRDSLDTGADLPARTGDEIRAAQGWLQDSTWTNLLAEIRSLPGFAGFLAAPGWAELRQAGSAGAVVVVNAQFGNSAAILLRDGAPVAVPLDHLSLADVRRYAGALLRADQEDLTRIVPEMLAWLWESINEPVLAALGHTTTPGANQQWPRVWWLPIGSLGVLPLHAAGFTPDRVISSYTPTIRALLRARRPPAGARRHLAVAMSRTPGQAALPGAVAETMTLPDAVRLTDSDAVADRVLAALRESTWAHFACHATGDNTAAGLLLHDRPLLVADIARAGGQDAELAYLSACSTARAGRRSPDEAIHLASAFQLAGYRHVIGSLWPLQDTVATFAGQRFYQLVQNADTAAQALHQLTLELRTYYPYRPDTWAPLIHSGP